MTWLPRLLLRASEAIEGALQEYRSSRRLEETQRERLSARASGAIWPPLLCNFDPTPRFPQATSTGQANEQRSQSKYSREKGSTATLVRVPCCTAETVRHNRLTCAWGGTRTEHRREGARPSLLRTLLLGWPPRRESMRHRLRSSSGDSLRQDRASRQNHGSPELLRGNKRVG